MPEVWLTQQDLLNHTFLGRYDYTLSETQHLLMLRRFLLVGHKKGQLELQCEHFSVG